MGLVLVDAGPARALPWGPVLPVLALAAAVALAWDPLALDLRASKLAVLQLAVGAWAIWTLTLVWARRDPPLALGIPLLVFAWAVLPGIVRGGPSVRLLEEPVYFGFLALAWALVGRALGARTRWPALLWGFTALAGAIAFGALLELALVGPAPGFHGVVGGMGNPNDLAVTLVLLLPATLTCARSESRRGGPGLAAFVVILVFGALGATGSHTALLAAAAALGLIAALPTRPLPRLARLLVLGAMLGVAWLARAELDQPVEPQVVTSAATEVDGAVEDGVLRAVEGRLYLLARSAEVVAVDPLRGVGAGEFGWAFALAQAEHLEAHPEDLRFHTRLVHAHNDPLELLAEYGLVGLAALGLGLALLRRFGRREPREDTPAFALLGVLFFGLVSLLHPALFLPQVGLLGVVYLAVLVPPRPSTLGHGPRSALGVATIAAIALGMAVTVAQVRGARATVRGIQAAEAGDLERALERFEEASSMHPDGRALFHEGRVLLELGRPEDALESLEAAGWLVPVAEVHINLGLARCQTGDMDGGLRSIELARRLDPTRADVWTPYHEACGGAAVEAGE